MLKHASEYLSDELIAHYLAGFFFSFFPYIRSLLTGLYPPSSGTIIVDGKDIRTELAAIRTELGVCPQYDVLFNALTVREHLLLYGSVKAPGWTKEQLDEQVSGWVFLPFLDICQVNWYWLLQATQIKKRKCKTYKGKTMEAVGFCGFLSHFLFWNHDLKINFLVSVTWIYL